MMTIPGVATCEECYREFDLSDELDNNEWFFGHDCESEV